MQLKVWGLYEDTNYWEIEKNFDTILNDNIDNFIKKHYKDTI